MGVVNCRGFTYLWVLLLVALMGVGLTVAVEIDSVATQRDQERELLSIGRQFRYAIGRYYEAQQSGGRREYPPSLEELLRDSRFPGVRRHLRRVFVDPMTGKPEWGLLRANGRIVGVYSLAEKRPIKQEGFEPSDAAFSGSQQIREWRFTYPHDLMVQEDGTVLLPVVPVANPQAQGANALPQAVQGIATSQGVPAQVIRGETLTSVKKE